MLDESAPVMPLTVYAKSKTLLEDELTKMASDSFCPVYLRNATAYGASPGLRLDLVLNDFVASGVPLLVEWLLKPQPVVVYTRTPSFARAGGLGQTVALDELQRGALRARPPSKTSSTPSGRRNDRAPGRLLGGHVVPRPFRGPGALPYSRADRGDHGDRPHRRPRGPPTLDLEVAPVQSSSAW